MRVQSGGGTSNEVRPDTFTLTGVKVEFYFML